MTVAVVGGGAMGGVWAAAISATGRPVVVIDAAPAVVEAINTSGLIVESARGTQTAHVRATTRPAEVGPVDVIFFFVKAQQTAQAADQTAPLIGPQTTAVSLQNGWGNADVLAQRIPPQQLVIGVSYHSATVLAPGHIAHTGTGPTFVGPYADAALGRADAVYGLLQSTGMEVTLTPDIRTEIWKKLILNSATLATSALTGLRAGNLDQGTRMRELIDALAAESVAVARAQGYEIDLDERLQRIHSILAGAGNGKASMLQDVEQHRKTEIEVINGAIVRAAERCGIPVPFNRAMVALIDGLERGWQQ
jgi:2-dehydropantoate 2-reductase